MFRNIGELQQALAIQNDGTVTITGITIPDLAGIIGDCYGGNPIVLSGAQGNDDGENFTIVRTGKSSFLGLPDLPVVATFRLVTASTVASLIGTVKATLRYTLPTGWKFSDSFPELPKVLDWRKTVADPLSVPLDDLNFDNASFVVASYAHEDSGVRLRTGINFVGKIAVFDQEPSAGVTAAMKRVFHYTKSELLLTGSINLRQADNIPKLKAADELWANSDTEESASPNLPPGILLSANSGCKMTPSNSSLSFDGVVFRIYSPMSNAWLAANPSYAPMFAYTGMLRLPNSNPPASLSVTAFQELGGNELVLSGRFTNVGAGISGLADLSGSFDLHGSMGDSLKKAVDILEKVELYISLQISMNRGVEVTAASVMLSRPLDWSAVAALKHVFAVESVATLIEVRRPFSTGPEDPMDRFRFGKDRVHVTVMGRLKVFEKEIDFTATASNPYTFHARLADGKTIQLSDVIGKYPDSMPPLQPDPVIDYLALTARHSESTDSAVTTCDFAGRIKSDPKLEIVSGLKLSELAVHLTVTTGTASSVDGEIRAIVAVAGIDVSLKTRKKGGDWLFAGSTLPDQTIDLLALAHDRAIFPSSWNFPTSVTIRNADVSIALPDGNLGDFDFNGAAEFKDWNFNLGPASFSLKGLGGGIHLSKKPGANRARLFGSVVIGDNIEADASVQFGEADVNTIIDVALRASDNREPTVSSAIEHVAGQGRYTGLIPTRLSEKFRQFSHFTASINLTKSIYVVDGTIKDFGWAYLIYQGISEQRKESAYVFAAGLGPGFTFAKLLEVLKPVDSVLKVKSAMLAVYDLELTKYGDRSDALANIKSVAEDLGKKGASRWALANLTDPVVGKNNEVPNESGLILTVEVEVEGIFGKNYEFRGWLNLTPELMKGELAFSTSPTSTAEDKISGPFRLSGIEITSLTIQVEKRLNDSQPSIAILGSTRLGWRSNNATDDDRMAFHTELRLVKGNPALMSITLSSDLKVGAFVAQCITGNRDNWPDKYFELTLKLGSRVYYFDVVSGTETWETDEPAAGKYIRGFNVEATAEIALGNSTVSLDFLLSKKPVGFMAGGTLKSPVKLWCIELTGTQKTGNAYAGGPALKIIADDISNPWTFTLSVGVNLFGRAVCSTIVSISRPKAGGTQLAGTINSDESLQIFGKLSLKFAYLRHEDGTQSFSITEWPSFDVLKDVFEIFKTIQEIADKLAVDCDVLAGFLSDRITSTKMNYSVAPSATAEGENLRFMLCVKCTMSTAFGDVQILEINPNVAVHTDIALSDLPDKLMAEVPKALANALLEGSVKSTVGIVLFLAITFGKDGVKIAFALACRGLVKAVVAEAVEILVAALTGGAAALVVAIAVITAMIIKAIFGSSTTELPPQEPVLKLAPPATEKLNFSDAGGEDRVRLSWKWQGEANDFAFDAQLVDENANVKAGALPEPSATGASFDSTNLPVGIYRAKAHAKAKSSSSNAALIAPSEWSAPSECAIFKLSPVNLVEIGEVKTGALATQSVEVSMRSTVADADVYYARLFFPGDPVNQVEFKGNSATLSLPADYHGNAQVGVRAAKRDGSAISSNWHKRDVSRLAPLASATCTYDHGEGQLMLRFSPANTTVKVSYQYQIFTGVDSKPLGNPRPVVDAAGATKLPVGDLPAGPVQVAVRVVASVDDHLVPSAWCVAQPALRKLAEAAVTDVSYDLQTKRVHVKLEDAGPGTTYEAKFEGSDSVSAASTPEIDCPNPFAPDTSGTRTVSARLISADPAVIDGKWREADPVFKLTKFPPPSGPALIWDDRSGEIAVSFTPSGGTALHDVQFLANNESFGPVLLTEPNSSRKMILLDDDMPSGSIAVQVRSSGPASRTVAGDWVKSSTLDRPGQYAAQPRLYYTVGEEKIVVQWPSGSQTPVVVAVQLLSGQTTPVRAPLRVDFPTSSAPFRLELQFGDDLPPGEVRVRFRTMPSTASALPGKWTTSMHSLSRLAPASRACETSYVDGTLTLRVSVTSHDPRPTAFDLSFGKFPTMHAPATPPECLGAVLTVRPENFPRGANPVKIVTIGEADRTVNGTPTYLMASLCPLGRPVISEFKYASSELTLAWGKVEFFFGSDHTETYNVKIDAGDGNVKIFPATFESEWEGSSGTRAVSTSRVFELDSKKLEGLPAGVWLVSVQAVGLYGHFDVIGSGLWSEPASVFILEPPADLKARAETAKLAIEWQQSDASRRTYDVELSGPALSEPLLWHDLEAVLSTTGDSPARRISVNCDVSTVREGVYNVRVRAVSGGLKTAWSEPLSVNLTADLSGVFTYRKIGPSKAEQRFSYTVGGTNPLSDSHFDNLDEARRLKQPLSEIIVYRDYRGQIGGIQGCYGYGKEKTAGSVNGAGQEWQRIAIPPDGMITSISGSSSALNSREYRVDGLRFDGKGVPYPNSTGNLGKMGPDSFSFEAQQGEVVIGFFGTAYASSYADLLQARIEYLGSLGVWMKRVYSEMSGDLVQVFVGSKDHVWGIDSSGGLWRFTGDDRVWPFVQVEAPGKVDQVSLGADGTVLIAIKAWHSQTPNVYRLEKGSQEKWIPIPVAAKQISGASREHMWGTGPDGSAWRYYGSDYANCNLLFQPLIFDQLSGVADGTVWGIESNEGSQIYRFDRRSPSSTDYVATPIPGSLVQISVGSEHHVWGRQSSGQIVRYTGDAENPWEQVPGRLGNLDHVSVGADGAVWGVKAGKVYRCDLGLWVGI